MTNLGGWLFLHSNTVQGRNEQRIELYIKYRKGAAQFLTPQCAENISGAAGSAGRQADMAQGE